MRGVHAGSELFTRVAKVNTYELYAIQFTNIVRNQGHTPFFKFLTLWGRGIVMKKIFYLLFMTCLSLPVTRKYFLYIEKMYD